MTQCHAPISRENLPVPLKSENIIIDIILISDNFIYIYKMVYG